jgi:hypothetical protein
MVRQDTVPGTRRHVYALDDDHPWYTGSLSRDVVYDRILRVVRGELDGIPDGPVRDRLLDMESFYAYVRERLPRLYDEWRAFQLAEDGQADAARRSKAASSSASTD